MLKTFVVILSIIGIMDYIWLGIISGTLYPNAIKSVQGSPLNFRISPAIVAYILMALSLTILFEKKVITSTDNALYWGGFLGLAIYGIFNSTNHAIFNGWDIKTSVYDTMWGTFLFTFTAYITSRLQVYL